MTDNPLDAAFAVVWDRITALDPMSRHQLVVMVGCLKGDRDVADLGAIGCGVLEILRGEPEMSPDVPTERPEESDHA